MNIEIIVIGININYWIIDYTIIMITNIITGMK